jgi:hypothetical protein
MAGVDSQFRINGPFVYRSLARRIRELGPYAATALLLPGGSLIALSLCMLRHRTWLAARARRGLSAVWTAGVRLIFPH